MSEVPNPYFINIELFWPDGTRPNQNQIARVRALDVNGPVVTDEGQSGFDQATGGWMPVFMQNIAAFYPPRPRPNLRFQVESTQEQVLHVTQIFNEIPSGSTVKIIIGVSDELVGGGSGGGSFRVSGRVLRNDGSAVSSGTVRAFDVTNGSEAQLGADAIGSDGSYSITYTASSFEQNGGPPNHAFPNLQVRAYDSSGMHLATESRPSASKDELVDLHVGADSSEGKRRVFGKVTNTLGLPVSGIMVEAHCIAWTTEGIVETTVGALATANDAGDYEILYDLPSVAAPTDCNTPATQANLIVYAKEPPAGTTTIATSGLIFNAAVEQRADLVVDRVSSFDDSEYQRLHARLSACLGTGDVLWASLKSISERPEVLEFAAKASGEPRELVLAYARAWLIAGQIHQKIDSVTPAPLFKLKLASGVSPEGGVSPEVMYGLVRSGLGDDLRKLMDVTPDGFFRSTVDSIHGGLISPTIEPLLEPTTDTSHDSLLDDWKYVLSALLAAGDFGNNAPIWQQQLLKLVYPGDDQAAVDARKKITDAHFDNLGEFDALIADLLETGQIDDIFAKKLRFVFEMYDAVGRWYPIVAAVYKDRDNQGWTTIDKLAAVPVGPGSTPNWVNYVQLSFAEVSGVGGAYYPGDLPGGSGSVFGSSPVRTQVYAQRLFDLFGKRSPEDRFSSTLSQSTGGNPDLQDVATFLGANPTFSLENTNIKRYLEEHPPTTPLSSNALSKLKQVQRVYRVTSDYNAASALIANGLDSAVKIARYNEGDFIARYADALGGLTAARDVHRVALHYSSEVLFTLAKFHQNLTNVGGVTAVPGAVDFRVLNPTDEFDDTLFTNAGDTPGRTVRRFPNWVTLFGDVNKCACKQCQTVLSPGAYLVDLLEFIDGAPKKTLFTRRPDLIDIEITCPNTDKSLPYIDLVNEVLEAVVAPLPFTLPAALAGSLDQVASSGDATALATVRQAIESKGGTVPAGQAKAYILTEHFVVKLGPLNQRSNNVHFREWVLEDDGWRFTVQWVDNSGGPISVIPSPQTSPTSDSLEVFPEHFNVAAYDALKQAVFPFNLPLALDREELDIFLKVKNAPKHQILEAFSNEDLLIELASTDNALAFLNLTPEEGAALLATTPGTSTWNYWGFEGPTAPSPVTLPRPDKPTEQVKFENKTDVVPNVPAWVRAVSFIPVFLHRTGLSYQQLLDLLDTEFVHEDAANTAHGLHLVASDETDDLTECNYNNFQIAHLNEPTLRRISVFVRLWRKLGWTMREVDRYLMDIEGGQIPNDLVTLAQVKRLAEELKLKPLSAFAWWWTLDTRRTPRVQKSLFDEVFLVGPKNQPEIQSLERVAQGESIGIDPSELAEGEDLRSHVRAALRVKSADIELLWNAFVGSSTTLDIAQLSSMYRMASFANALRLSVKDLYDAIALTGANPFSTVVDPAQIPAAVLATYAALRELRRWQATKMSAPELRYLLTDQSEAGDAFVPSEDDFLQATQRLATAVAELAGAVPDVQNLDAAALTTQLAKVMPEDKIVHALEIVASATNLALGQPDRQYLDRYFAPFLPADPTAFYAAITSANGPPPTPPQTPPVPATPDVTTRYRLVWGQSPSVASLGADELKQVDPALRATVAAGFGPALFSYLFEQARTTAAFTAASEIVGIDRDTADRLLTTTLHSVDDTAVPPTIPAIQDWKDVLNGGFRSGEPVLVNAGPGQRESLLLVPRAGTYRFVALISAAGAPAADVTLAIDGDPVGSESVVTPSNNPPRTEITFAPQTLKAGSVVSITFGYSPAVAAKVTLLWRIDNADPVVVPQSAFLPFRREVYTKLFKAARLVKGLKLDKAELRYFVEVAQIPFNLDRLPVLATDAPVAWSDLATVIDLLALNRGVALKNQTLFEFFTDSAGGASLEEVAELTGWKAEDIDVVRGLFAPAPTFDDPKLWFALRDAFKIIVRLDLRASQIKELLIDSPPSLAIAATVRNVFRAQFSQDSWKEVFKPLRDKLRQRQRDALVGYLTSRKLSFAGNSDAYFIDANELYSQLLIDTQMEPDTLISRIKLALNVIQLFVDRVFLGLEDQASLIELEDAKQQWVWMSRYRVWEANRKVFLYPENFIEPELRDDKTELFKELEDELLQSELTHERGVVALTNYLDKMSEVSNLEVVGAFSDGSVLHVVGRTRSQSRGFYYRTFATKRFHDGNWTPWMKINLDMNADTVAPIVFQGRLRLVWPNLQTKQRPKATTATVDGTNIAAQGAGQKPDFFTEIRLMWSEYNADSKKWSKPRLSKSKATDTEVPTPFKTTDQEAAGDQPSTDPYHLRLEASSSDFLSVKLVKTNVPSTAGSLNGKALGTFKLWYTGDDTFEDGGSKQVTFSLNYPVGTVLKHNGAEEVSFAVNSTFSNDKLSFGGGWGFFDATPDVFRIFATNFGFADPAEYRPFFYETTRESLFAVNHGIVTEPSLGFQKIQRATFSTFNHPRVRDFQDQLASYGPAGIMNRLTQALPVADNRYYDNYYYNYYGYLYLGYHIAGDNQAWWTAQRNFQADKSPGLKTVITPYPLPTVEFGYGTSFGIYNWELFFHLPMLVANLLCQNLKFEDAMKWYHFVFDPRRDLEGYEKTKRFVDNLPDGSRYWNFLPFFANKDATDSLAVTLGLKQNLSTYDRQQLTALIDDWRNDPFKPHLIARQRIAAYQKNVVMKYLDNLIAWADSLFRQDTFETINLATQLYVLADELLGKRPEIIEPLTGEPKYTFRELQARGLDDFSNAIVEVENQLVSNRSFAKDGTLAPPSAGMNNLNRLTVKTFYFAIPRNERLDKYWDTVQDRLFKIRNSMNIDGVKRQLALFEPPIDPALLVRAAAAGLDLSSVLAQLSAPLPCYRFNVWIQKATELCNELKAFGAEFLAALEKKDGESLALLRQTHELKMLELVRQVREKQITEAEENITSLELSRALAELRRDEYQRRIAEDRTETERTQISATGTAGDFEEAQTGARAIASVFAFVPDPTAGAVGIFPSALFNLKTGTALHTAATIAADILGVFSSVYRNKAAIAGLNAGFDRRKEDWQLQKQLADKEIEQINQQIVMANIRLDIAQKELSNHEVQIEQSEEMLEFMRDKFTNRDLYDWMSRELSKTYKKVYQLAFDAAKTAERTYQFELGRDDTFIRYDYVDSLRQGLLSGERLIYDLKRLDIAYLEKNKRELEIQKPISLMALNADALQKLKETGACEFELPEVLFDLDFPGHYFRRIKAVRLTIPCVTGPHTSVSAKLSLLSSAIRKESAADPDAYAYQGFGDPRFVNDPIGIQSIATSSAQNDAGLFELNFRDERYLPFEGAGVISRWRLELPTALRQFDYNTISDAVLHVSYTARDAGGTLRVGAENAIQQGLNTFLKLASESETGLVRAISLRQEFPDVLHRLLAAPNIAVPLTLQPEHFPFLLRSTAERSTLTILGGTSGPANPIDVHAIVKADADPGDAFSNTASITLTQVPPAGPGTPSTGNFNSGNNPRARVATVSKGGDANLLGGEDWTPETWNLSQSGLIADKIQDLVLLLKYKVDLPDPA